MAFIILVVYLLPMLLPPMIHFPVDCCQFILHFLNFVPVLNHFGVLKEINVDALISIDVNVRVVLANKIEFFTQVQHFYKISEFKFEEILLIRLNAPNKFFYYFYLL